MVGWKTARLRDVCQIKPPKKEARQRLADTDLVSFVPMNNLGKQQKDLVLNAERELREVNGSYTYFADNDVLLAKITPCFENGKLGIARNLKNGIGFGSSEFIVFRSNGDIDPEFLFYFLSQDSFRDAGARLMTGAVGHKRVPKEFIENYPILVPPIPEQGWIVAILDEAFAAIEIATKNAEKSLANARELFKSHLKANFTPQNSGWSEKRFEDVCVLQRGFDLPKRLRDNGEYPLLSSSGPIDTHVEARVAGPGVVVGRSGSVGSVFFVEEDFWPLNTVLYVKNFRNNDPEFVYWFLMQFGLQDYAGGAGVPTLNRNHVHDVLVTVPSDLREQGKLVARINGMRLQTDSFRMIFDQKLDLLEKLKQSILHKAFTGELTADSKSVDRALSEAGV
ncbi:MAG: restriction endonuclease subunit S [Candidatus Eisenbacteria bacterium]|uniref:Restriction endonuclease subunit S n=1 Tax=Eiseniibacteriota bacterium TaxID=2212470 RepID=A0A948RRM9_UNCEI|nr:restriction endonuclease subunit S [Candidatus Eisenbacteria bacterium]MBU1948637.1 restriction endonuclease subunit S [Candidatus Eisenbacteria bacterium]MBU2689748.1 restriction endonuclease subunit S [Candidatus Eisenbacteria bacterium]